MAEDTVRGQRLKSFGTWMASMRGRLRISQAEAAKIAGLSRTQWTRIELGQSGTRPENMEGIAKALQISEDEVYHRAGLIPPHGVSALSVSKPSGEYELHATPAQADKSRICLEILVAYYISLPPSAKLEAIDAVGRIARKSQSERAVTAERPLKGNHSDVNAVVSPPRVPGTAAHLPHFMADDFDATPEGFEEYMP